MRVTWERIYTIELTETEMYHLLRHLEDDIEGWDGNYMTELQGQSVLGFAQALRDAMTTKIK